MRRIGMIFLAIAALALAPAPAGGGTTRVKAAGSPGSFHWQPDFKHIVKGTKVVWKNPTSSPHTVAAYSDNWSKNATIAAGDGRTAKTFKRPGLYRYRCTQTGHSSLSGGECSGMCGEVHVTRG